MTQYDFPKASPYLRVKYWMQFALEREASKSCRLDRKTCADGTIQRRARCVICERADRKIPAAGVLYSTKRCFSLTNDPTDQIIPELRCAKLLSFFFY